MSSVVAVLGSGTVGEILANGFLKKGYTVVRGTRDPAKMDSWLKSAGPKASVDKFSAAAKRAQIIVLAVKGLAAEEVVASVAADISGKTVIDATNPIADQPPTNGVLPFFTDLKDSLMERLQRKAPSAKFVKAFSCVGNALMVDPDFAGVRPTMFICGNDKDAKMQTKEVLSQFGWETEDMGGVEGARAIEPLCILWCIPGFQRNQWMHAFKLLKRQE